MECIDQGSGETLVLLHGLCGSSEYWKEIIPMLSDHYRVIAPDLRGHGRSESPIGKYSMDAMADDIARLLERLKIGKAVVFGHSLGGYVTLALAEKYPHLLRGFSLVHSTAFPDDETGKANRDKNVHLIRQQGIKPFIDNLTPKLFAPENVSAMKDTVEDIHGIGLRTTPEGAIGSLEGMRDRPDRLHIIMKTTVPILLVAGTEDQIIPLEKSFAGIGPHVTTAKLNGAGHLSLRECPEQLANTMNTWLSDQLPSA